MGQDGGVVSAILVYLLENDIVDEVSVVGEDKDAPWGDLNLILHLKSRMLLKLPEPNTVLLQLDLRH